MNYFPQLESGAVAQFPVRRRARHRTVLNEAGDGSQIRFSDVNFEERGWELRFEGISDAEWQAIEDLFVNVEGRLGTFLFLEPGANLLAWSEKQEEDVWQSDAGIEVLAGQTDPLGGAEARTISAGGSSGALWQAMAAPAGLRYAGSIWARTSASGAALQVSDGVSAAVTTAIDSSNEWKRYSIASALGSSEEAVHFRIVAPAGGSVTVFGAQLEAQAMPSDYKKTLEQPGVYPNARFDQDVLADEAEGPDRHAGVVRVTWTPLLS
jgi:hypothetical protein